MSSKQQYEQLAREALHDARTLRISRAHIVAEAYGRYGERGPLTSGVEQTHWPEDLKDVLRANATRIGQLVEGSLALWRMAGRRRSTWRPLAEAARIPGSRY